MNDFSEDKKELLEAQLGIMMDIIYLPNSPTKMATTLIRQKMYESMMLLSKMEEK